MPPVFMHSSTMSALRVFFTLLEMVSMSKGFRLMRSMTWGERAVVQVLLDCCSMLCQVAPAICDC
jgi:hypothetical protein